MVGYIGSDGNLVGRGGPLEVEGDMEKEYLLDLRWRRKIGLVRTIFFPYF